MADSKVSPTLAALKQMADDELVALKALYVRREAAARRYEVATAALAEAEASARKARDEQQAAIDDLLGAGMAGASVAELLGIDQHRVRPPRSSRSSRSRRPAPPKEAQPVPFGGPQPPTDLSVVA